MGKRGKGKGTVVVPYHEQAAVNDLKQDGKVRELQREQYV